jgi:hypothetical protein
MWPFKSRRKKQKELYHKIAYAVQAHIHFTQMQGEYMSSVLDSDYETEITPEEVAKLYEQLSFITNETIKLVSTSSLLSQLQREYLCLHFYVLTADMYTASNDEKALVLYEDCLESLLKRYQEYAQDKDLTDLLDTCEVRYLSPHEIAFSMGTSANMLEQRDAQKKAYLFCIEALKVEELGYEKWNMFMDYGAEILFSAVYFLDIPKNEKRTYLLALTDTIYIYFTQHILSDKTLAEAVAQAGYRPTRLFDHIYRIYSACGRFEDAQEIEKAVKNAPTNKDWREMFDWQGHERFTWFKDELNLLASPDN